VGGAGTRMRERSMTGVVTPRAASDGPTAWGSDASIWSLVLANALALIVALWLGWSLVELMMVFWAQSVAIGIANVFRILALEKFSTANFTINDRAVDPTPGTKRQVALFFLAHYGFFHAVYLVFLLSTEEGAGIFASLGFWLCAAAFALNHTWSYRYNRDIDRLGTPNIGTLMFTPYLRVVPMHLMIVFGLHMVPSSMALVMFGLLKTAADVGMHLVEHAQLKRVRTRAAS